MGYPMSGFIVGTCRTQATLFPDSLDDYISEENAIRVIDAFIDSLDLATLGFKTVPADTGRPAYHPSTLLKVFVYGYLNRVQSSRRLEREAGRNVELMCINLQAMAAMGGRSYPGNIYGGLDAACLSSRKM